jgi:hypothetical protein
LPHRCRTSLGAMLLWMADAATMKTYIVTM